MSRHARAATRAATAALLCLALAACAARSADVASSGKSSPTFWVYHNGEFHWAADYSWNCTIDYRDTSGAPVEGRYDIAVKIIDRWGGFQPYAQGKRFDVRPYKYLVYSLKPTMAGQVFSTGFEAVGDVPDGHLLNITGPPYGPVPVAGKWASYKIPLAGFELTNPLIQKFTIADGTGVHSNLFYVDNVGFTAD